MESDFTDRVTDYIHSHSMIDRGEKVCVAVSGGADSMCLLLLLKGLSKSMGFSLSAVHVEHGIRGQDSLEDMAFVSLQCKMQDIPLKTFSIDAVSVAEETGTTLEEAARNERYRIFSILPDDRIALAHHMNDQAETFLFNVSRGTGTGGLKGMLPVRERYIRPLLCVTRREIEEYCHDNHIEYRTDATNADVNISRNRIRHDIVPGLEQINPGAVRHIFEITEEISRTENYLSEITMTALMDCVVSEDDQTREITIDLDLFEKLHDAIASRVIKEALIRISGRSKDISRRHVDSVLDLARGQSGHHVDLIYGIKARKTFRKLIIKGPGQYELTNPDNTTSFFPKLENELLSRDEVSKETILSPDNYTKYIDYATIGDASLLTVRFRQPGDHISIKDGRKKLKDLLIEGKIPKEERDNMILVALGSEIVWIPKLKRIGERFKVTEDTKKILRMELKNG